jgi:hypothetical protein
MIYPSQSSNTPRAPYACALACERGVLIRLLRVHVAQMAFQTRDDSSSREINLPAAFSFLTREVLDLHCFHVQLRTSDNPLISKESAVFPQLKFTRSENSTNSLIM